MTLLFLFAAGAGQITCPIYMSIRTSTFGLSASTLFAIAFLPLKGFLYHIAILGMGFFGRGLYVSALVYLNEIGGDRFRAWSMLVVFGIWGISTIFGSITRLGLPVWI